MSSKERHIALFYKEGTSDKVYKVDLSAKGSGYEVSISYGRRGSPLTTQFKTSNPVDLEEATAIYDGLVHKKLLKGYTQEEGEVPFSGSEKEEKISGILPQLLNNIEETDLKDYFSNDSFCLQEKKDGKRIIISKKGSVLKGINRKGLFVELPSSIIDRAASIHADFIVDGELIEDTIWLFDIFEWNTEKLDKFGYHVRYDRLIQYFQCVDFDNSAIRLVKAYFDAEAKKQAFKKFKKEGVEGVVFKRITAPYKAGRPASKGDQLKYKFTNTATCQVSGLNEKGKRSVYIQMLDEEKLVDVGKITVLPNFEIPKIGTLIEVKYLYRHIHGALYQPVYLGERDDLDKPDQVKTLKVKKGIIIEEEEE